MIAIDGLTKTYGSGERAVRALDDVTDTIRENELFTLLGPTGCGKTRRSRSLS